MVTPRRTDAVSIRTSATVDAARADQARADREALALLEQTSTRRFAVAAERRRRRTINASYSVAVILGAAGTLAFASILVSGH